MADHASVAFRWWLRHPEVFRHHQRAVFQQHLVGLGMFIVRLPLHVLGLSNAGSRSSAWCGTAVTGTGPARLGPHIEETLRTADPNARHCLTGSPRGWWGRRVLSDTEMWMWHGES